MVFVLHTIFLPALGCKIRSFRSVLITLSLSLKSPLITRGEEPNGSNLISSTSTNVSGATARPQKDRVADPFVAVPEVCVGSLPLVAVVPATVTS